jgi:hypothetical protein
MNDAQLAANDPPNARMTGSILFRGGLFAALRVPNAMRRGRGNRMDTFGVTLDVDYAAIDGLYAAKKGSSQLKVWQSQQKVDKLSDVI